jgi:hypothetical protein
LQAFVDTTAQTTEIGIERKPGDREREYVGVGVCGEREGKAEMLKTEKLKRKCT